MKMTKLCVLTVMVLSSLTMPVQNLETEPKLADHDKGESDTSVFLILDVTVSDIIMYEKYRIAVAPMIEQYGGKYLVHSGGMSFDHDAKTKEVLIEGDWNPNRFIVLEWDSLKQIEKFVQ